VTEILSRGQVEVTKIANSESFQNVVQQVTRIANSESGQSVVQQVKGASDRTVGPVREAVPPVTEILSRGQVEVTKIANSESFQNVVQQVTRIANSESGQNVVQQVKGASDRTVGPVREAVPPVAELLSRGQVEVTKIANSESFQGVVQQVTRIANSESGQSVVQQVKGASDRTVGPVRQAVPPVAQTLARGSHEVIKVAPTESIQNVVTQVKVAAEKTVAQPSSNSTTDKTSPQPTKAAPEFARNKPDLLSGLTRKPIEVAALSFKPNEIPKPAAETTIWTAKIDAVSKELAQQVEKIPLDRRTTFTSSLIEFANKLPARSEVNTVKLSSLTQSLPLDLREPVEALVKTARNTITLNVNNKSIAVETKFFFGVTKTNSFSEADLHLGTVAKKNDSAPYESRPAAFSTKYVVPTNRTNSEISSVKSAGSSHGSFAGDLHPAFIADLAAPFKSTTSIADAAVTTKDGIDSGRRWTTEKIVEQEGGEDDVSDDETEPKPAKKKRINSSKDDLEITGVEIALVGALIVAAVAKIHPDAAQQNANVLGMGKVLYRPKHLVERRDTLFKLGEDGFGDARIGWLILELNAGSFNQEWRGIICVVTLKARQEIDLPVIQDISEFKQRMDKYEGKTIVSIVTENAFDRELMHKRLGDVV